MIGIGRSLVSYENPNFPNWTLEGNGQFSIESIIKLKIRILSLLWLIIEKILIEFVFIFGKFLIQPFSRIQKIILEVCCMILYELVVKCSW